MKTNFKNSIYSLQKSRLAMKTLLTNDHEINDIIKANIL